MTSPFYYFLNVISPIVRFNLSALILLDSLLPPSLRLGRTDHKMTHWANLRSRSLVILEHLARDLCSYIEKLKNKN